MFVTDNMGLTSISVT